MKRLNKTFKNKFLDILCYVILSASVLYASYIVCKIGKYLYNDLRDKIVDIKHFTDGVNKKPTYEYLKSFSVYIFHIIDETDGKRNGAIGSGVVIAEKEGYYYILTNKHVCTEDNDNCYIMPNGDPKSKDKIKLEFVESDNRKDIDLELWKVSIAFLTDKQPVKKVEQSYPQEKVYNVGNYLGNAFIYSEGTNAGIEDIYDLFNLPSGPGCSGSGIYNSDGNLVGLTFAGNGMETNVPFVIAFDNSKAIAVSGTDIQIFLKEVF